MLDFISSHEPDIRLGVFFGVFALMALWEVLAPRRVPQMARMQRWPGNLGMMITGTVLVRLIFPAAAMGMALFAQQHAWGVFNYFLIPAWLAVPACVIALDLAIYLQHVMVHAIPALWRLHRVHHADLDFDVTTGVRFHPLEILVSMLIKFAVIGVLGPPLVAVVIFEVVLNAASMFNHSNVRLPPGLDRVLRWVLVTPDMHRVHHSVEDDETNSNFGFSLPWWDRLFGTYRAQPRHGHEGMQIGIHGFRDAKQVDRLPGMLTLPFIGRVSGYAINRRTWSKPGADDQ